MTDKTRKTRRVVSARRTLAVGTIAATTLGGTADAAGKVTPGISESPDWVQMASAEGEGEGASHGEGEGEGEGASHGEGEGEGEGEGASHGEGEGGGEGEGEGASHGEGEGGGEGEGEGASHGEGEGGGEGEGEGGGDMLEPEAGLTRDLGFMEGHLRAGMALYQAGDLEAAKTHMGHPIEEKYEAVAEPLAERGYGRLKEELSALAEAAESGTSAEEVEAAYDKVLTTVNAARGGISTAHRAAGLVALTRVAADEYTVATEGGQISNLHEYQDSWGFLRVVADEAADLAGSGDPAAARAGEKMQAALEATGAVFGDLQGGGDYAMDASVIYGAAARMQLAAAGL